MDGVHTVRFSVSLPLYNLSRQSRNRDSEVFDLSADAEIASPAWRAFAHNALTQPGRFAMTERLAFTSPSTTTRPSAIRLTDRRGRGQGRARAPGRSHPVPGAFPGVGAQLHSV